MQPINDLLARMTRYQELITNAAQRVITSGWWILGPECKRFEQAFADYIGVNHCVGVANGTEALELALKALGIKTNDLVATVANAGMYTTSSVLTIGARPFFMDVDPNTFCVTLDEVRRAVQAGAKAIVITHLYGQAVPELLSITQYCAQNNVRLVEDCAQAHGARINGKTVGSFSDIATFSFYPTKNLGALGDGGAIVTNHEELANQLRLLSQYGWTSKYRVEIAGARNSRLDEMQAAILYELLPFLDEANARRQAIANIYDANIKHPLIKTPRLNGESYVAHLYVIRSSRRDELRHYLHKFKIASEIHYPIPDHRQPVFGNQFCTIELKNSEELSQEILTLPCYPEMSTQELDSIITTINGWQR